MSPDQLAIEWDIKVSNADSGKREILVTATPAATGSPKPLSTVSSEAGHKTYEFPQKKTNIKKEKNFKESSMGAIPPAKNWITGKVNGISQRILIDSGATVGVVTPEVAAATDYKTKAGRRVSLHGAIRGDRDTIMVKYEFGNSSFEREAAVSESSEDFQGIIFPWDISNRAEGRLSFHYLKAKKKRRIV